MEITKFKHAKALKNFRVVVNEPIEFDVSGSQLITDFYGQWRMNSLNLGIINVGQERI